MPSIRMKTKLREDCLTEKNGLPVCQKSNVISKKTCCQVRISNGPAGIDSCIQNCQDVLLSTQVSIESNVSYEAIDHQQSSNEETSELQTRPSFLINSATMGRVGECTPACSSDLETIFSPILEHIEDHSELNTDNYEGSNNDSDMPRLGTNDSDDNRSSYHYETCDVSDFYVSDMVIASLPFNGIDDISESSCAEPSVLFDVADHFVILPLLEENTLKINSSNESKTSEEALIDPGNASLYVAIDQMKPTNQEEFDVNSDSDQAECFDPQLFIKNLPELSDVVMNFQPNILPQKTEKRKAVTLVLDLDETLVHSTLEHCDDADFSFTVFFNMKEHIVCVKQRPYLHMFLERVAEMFEVVIFTASQSIYAGQVLNKLDPEGKLISRRVYRESCIFSDGSYTKDLTVLGIDLAKVVIVDNNPQVFRLQVNNGIPIKSWFDDPSDCALISLLPFLETLVEAGDVRPIIAQRFGNKE